jgi:Uma2 family endonuclease
VAIETETLEVHRWTPEEYHRLFECGGLDEDIRIELIDGLVLDMSPRTPAHEQAVTWLLNRLLALGLDPARFEVQAGTPLSLGTSEPEPDLTVVEVDAPRPYHASTAALVIEVSVSSLRRDLRQKPILYARAGVPVYWVIDIHGRRAVIHSEPREDGYGRVDTCGADGCLVAPHVGLAEIAFADVLAAAGV